MDVFKAIEEKVAEVAAHLKSGLPSLATVEGTVHEDAVKVAHAGADALTWLGAQAMQDLHRIANALETLASKPVSDVEHAVENVVHSAEAQLNPGVTQADIDAAALAAATHAQAAE